jgi:hypothetical protein
MAPPLIRLLAVLVALVAAFGCSPHRSAAAAPAPVAKPQIDLYAGEWELNVVWAGNPANGAKHWRGTMTLARAPGSTNYTGTLVLRCQDTTWVVTQDVEVTIDHEVMKVVGANVEEVEKPAGGGGYSYDVFEVQERNGLWFSGDASGGNSGSGSVTIMKAGGPA